MKIQNLFLVIFLGFILLLPMAGFSAGLIPCEGTESSPCTICHLFQLMNNVWVWIITYIVTPVAVLMLMIGGFYMLTAAGNPQQIETGKKILTAAVIGVAIIFLAFILVNMVFDAMGVSDLKIRFNSIQEWAQFNCPVR